MCKCRAKIIFLSKGIYMKLKTLFLLSMLSSSGVVLANTLEFESSQLLQEAQTISFGNQQQELEQSSDSSLTLTAASDNKTLFKASYCLTLNEYRNSSTRLPPRYSFTTDCMDWRINVHQNINVKQVDDYLATVFGSIIKVFNHVSSNTTITYFDQLQYIKSSLTERFKDIMINPDEHRETDLSNGEVNLTRLGDDIYLQHVYAYPILKSSNTPKYYLCNYDLVKINQNDSWFMGEIFEHIDYDYRKFIKTLTGHSSAYSINNYKYDFAFTDSAFYVLLHGKSCHDLQLKKITFAQAQKKIGKEWVDKFKVFAKNLEAAGITRY